MGLQRYENPVSLSNMEIIITALIGSFLSIAIFNIFLDSPNDFNVYEWILVGVVGSAIVAVSAWLLKPLFNRKQKREKQKQDLYNYFFIRYKNERYAILGEGGGVPMAIYSRIELLPFEWIEAREEYKNMKKSDKKLLREIYGKN